MNHKIIKNLRLFLNVLSIVIIFVLFLPRLEKWIFSPKVEGQRAPYSALYDLDGQAVDLPVLGTKQIYIFWATWCTPCTAELAMYDYAVKNKKLPADQVIAIAVGEKIEVVRDVVQSRDYALKVYIDATGEMAAKYGVQGTPTSVFVDRDGVINKFSTGVSPLVFAGASGFLRE